LPLFKKKIVESFFFIFIPTKNKFQVYSQAYSSFSTKYRSKKIFQKVVTKSQKISKSFKNYSNNRRSTTLQRLKLTNYTFFKLHTKFYVVLDNL